MARWLALMLCCAISTVSFTKEVLKVALPLPKGSKESALTQKLIARIFDNIGCLVAFENLPIERCTQLVVSGEYDILPGKPKDEMDAFKGFPVIDEPYLEVPFYVYGKKNVPKEPTWKMMEQLNCVGIIGVRLVDERMPNALKSAKLQRVATYDQALKMLIAGRASYAILIEPIADDAVARQKISGLIKSERPIERTVIYIVMSKRHAALAKKAAESLRQMKADGSYYRILREFR